MDFKEVISNLNVCKGRREIEQQEFQKLALALGHNRLDCNMNTKILIYELLLQLDETKKENNRLKELVGNTNDNVSNIRVHYKNMSKEPIAKRVDITKELVIETLRNCGYDKGLTATVLNCSRQTIYNRLKGD